MRLFTETDADPGLLRGKTIAVAGYGNQGRPQALNLRDSGCRVVVGARPGGKAFARAREDGFETVTIAAAAAAADVCMMLLPDEIQGDLYRGGIRDALRPGAALVFAHGFAVAFGEIDERERDVVLVAPKGQGGRLREAYVAGSGVPCLVGVENDATGRALATALAVAGALGCLRVGAYETSCREEAVSDIFGEQAVLCGGVPAVMKRAFDLLVRKGYAPEIAYFECYHELKIIVDLLEQRGLAGMRDVISGTAAYGSLAYGEGIIGDEVGRNMERLYERIASGEFARDWLAERRSGGAWLARLREAERSLPIEATGRSVRGLVARRGGDNSTERKKRHA